LKYVVSQITELYNSKDKSELPDLYEPIPVVVCGGTSLIDGFIKTFDEIIKENKDFPIPIKEIKMSEEPLYCVSHGLYQAGRIAD
jgi:hypothetical protein